MNHLVPVWRELGTAFVAVLVAVSSAAAQTNSPAEQYPYWSSAPQNYSGSQVTIPVPGISPNMISNASRGPSLSGRSSNLGGGYIPPNLHSRELTLPQRERPETSNKAHILVRVPENAEIWVNGVKTKQTGEARYFFSPPLTPGKKYNYQMRVRWTNDGKPVEETQNILVQAGATIHREIKPSPLRGKSETRNPKSERNSKSEY